MARDANGTGTEQPVYSSDDSDAGSNDWSRDGRRMLVSILPASRRWDIKSISMDGTATVSDYLVTDASEIGPSFSPDGRFVAYSSNESGTGEIYVQTFPPGGGKWQISNGGGQQARWRADGSELFFMTPTDVLRAVPVSTAGTFEPGMPVDLFKRPIERGANMRNRYFPSADGQRFLVNAARQTSQAAPLSVIINWPATLAK
jgi:Tol biopolymer transport system component